MSAGLMVLWASRMGLFMAAAVIDYTFDNGADNERGWLIHIRVPVLESAVRSAVSFADIAHGKTKPALHLCKWLFGVTHGVEVSHQFRIGAVGTGAREEVGTVIGRNVGWHSRNLSFIYDRTLGSDGFR